MRVGEVASAAAGEGHERTNIHMQPRPLISFAKQLRRNSTDAERLLWSRLRARRFFDSKWKRQQSLGSYIVDFVCFESRVVIELDGGQHASNKDADVKRDAWLRGEGFVVLRFWNNEVLGNLEGVLVIIARYLSSSPHPRFARPPFSTER
jgi:very-short-patch-repair endonuclease